MLLSICIPTYNRAHHLINCLNSISIAATRSRIQFEVCISDNCSTDNTEQVVQSFEKKLQLSFHKQKSNLGIPQNFLHVVSMASAEYIWLIGDDDLLLPDSIINIHRLFNEYPHVDFFFVNSYHLSTEYISKYPSPFDTAWLPQAMAPFSTYTKDGELEFFELINPKVTFDFLGGMFLSAFRRSNWSKSVDVLDPRSLQDKRVFSHFDNTFPHIKIFASAFKQSRAYFNSQPLNVCLTGAREWAPMYPFIQSVRLVEALDVYREQGLGLGSYLYCKNSALRNFIPDLLKIVLRPEASGLRYVNLFKILASNCLYPNTYLSILYFLLRRIQGFLRAPSHDCHVKSR